MRYGGHLEIGLSECPNVQTVRAHCHIFERRLNCRGQAAQQSVTLPPPPAALLLCYPVAVTARHPCRVALAIVTWIMLQLVRWPSSIIYNDPLKSLPVPALQSQFPTTHSTVVLEVPTKLLLPFYLLWHTFVCSWITLISLAAHSTSPCRHDAAAFSFSLTYNPSCLVAIACRPLHIKGGLCRSLPFACLSVPLLASSPTQLAHSIQMYVHFFCLFRYVHTPLCEHAHSICPYSLVTYAYYLAALIFPSSMVYIPPTYALTRRCRCGADVPLRFVLATNLWNAGRPYYVVCLLTSFVPLSLIVHFCSVSNVAIGIDGAMALQTLHATLQRHHLPLIRVSH